MLAEVLRRAEIKAVGTDRAYDIDAIRQMIAAAGKEAVIPPRSNRVKPADYDKEKYKGRNQVERLFNRFRKCVRSGFSAGFEAVEHEVGHGEVDHGLAALR